MFREQKIAIVLLLIKICVVHVDKKTGVNQEMLMTLSITSVFFFNKINFLMFDRVVWFVELY